jgi:molybdate transport system substrate-binding protein
LRPSFEAATGYSIDADFGAVGAMHARLLAGDPADVIILSRALIEGLATQACVLADSVADLGTVATSVAVRQCDPSPSIADKFALRTTLLAADALHFPDPVQATAGSHFAKVLRALGIRDEVESRLRPAPNGATAMRALAESKAARPIGCT